MENLNNILRPSQPYFVFDTIDYRQEIYLKDGISHFYTFKTDTEKNHRLVPDGCISLIFEYDPERPGHMHSYVCGTKLQFEIDNRHFHNEIFGVCFIPENHPEMLNITMKDLLQKRYPTEEVLNGDKSWLKDMANETDFKKRIEIFIKYYSMLEPAKKTYFGRKELIHAIRKMVYQSNGNIKIHDMEVKTKYSERYINKVFIEEMGFSPKIFCKIIQFQKTLELFSNGRPKNMTEIYNSLGYYDQSHFIRNFSKYCGMTPLKYLKLQEQYSEQNKKALPLE